MGAGEGEGEGGGAGEGEEITNTKHHMYVECITHRSSIV